MLFVCDIPPKGRTMFQQGLRGIVLVLLAAVGVSAAPPAPIVLLQATAPAASAGCCAETSGAAIARCCAEVPGEYIVQVKIVSLPKGHTGMNQLFAPAEQELQLAAVRGSATMGRSVAVLSKNEFKDVAEKIFNDKECEVMSALRMMLMNQQQGNCEIGQSQTFTTGLDVRIVEGNVVMIPKTETIQLGTKLGITIAKQDGKPESKVKLEYSFQECMPLHPVTTFIPMNAMNNKDAGQPIPFTQFIQVPKIQKLKATATEQLKPGHTMAVRVGTLKRTQSTVTKLGAFRNIPYLNRLFKNTAVGEVEHDVVLFATVTPAGKSNCCEVGAQAASEVLPQPRQLNTIQWEVLPSPRLLVDSPRTTQQAGSRLEFELSIRRDPNDVTELLAQYRRACALGKKDEAARLAIQALAKDPTCFAPSR